MLICIWKENSVIVSFAIAYAFRNLTSPRSSAFFSPFSPDIFHFLLQFFIFSHFFLIFFLPFFFHFSTISSTFAIFYPFSLNKFSWSIAKNFPVESLAPPPASYATSLCECGCGGHWKFYLYGDTYPFSTILVGIPLAWLACGNKTQVPTAENV